MKKNTKWKDRLLSSSLPLEFEVAKILAKEDYFIDYDYSYQRLDDKEQKEFSIDINATGYYPFGLPNEIKLVSKFLIECKYRNPEVKWAFLPDIEKDKDLRSMTRSLNFIDEFSEYRFDHWSFANLQNVSSKGVEINIQNGEVHDKGINHGVNQLIYSLPIIIKELIRDSLEDALEDVFPYVISPILVTTAELRLLNEDFSIESLKKTDSLEEISSEVPFLIYSTDLYPSFKRHCRNLFKYIPSEDQKERYTYYNKLRAIKVDYYNGKKIPSLEYCPTENLMDSLKKGAAHHYYKDIIICNLKNLPELITMLKNIIEESGKKMKKLEHKL